MRVRLQASPWALLAASLLLCCLGLLLLLDPVSYSVQTLRWQSEQGESLQARLWLPDKSGPDAQQPLQGVLLVHGVASQAMQLAPAARSLAAGGQAVMTLSLRGTEAEQLQQLLSAVQLLRSQPRIHGVALIGHSRGARLAAQAAVLAGEAGPVIALGARPEGLPLNAVMTGIYDSLHPPWRLPAGPERYVSPSASHQSVWHDLHLLRQFNHLLSGEASPIGTELLRFWVQNLLGLSLLVLGATQYPLRPGGYPGVVLLSAASAGLLVGGYLGWLQPPAAMAALLVLWAVYLLGQLPVPLWRYRLLRLVLGLVLLREGGALLRALCWDPTAVIWWPLALAQNLLVYPLLLQRGLTQIFFVPDAAQLQPAWPLLALLGAEILFPAWWRRPLLAARSESELSGPATPADSQKPAVWQFFSAQKIMALCVLLALLAGLLIWRLAQGYLSAESLGRLAETLALEIVPGALLAGLLWLGWRWRSPRDKKECPRDDSNVRPTV